MKQFGTDEWAVRQEEIAAARGSVLWQTWQRLDLRLKLLAGLALAALLPLGVHNNYTLRVAGLTGLYVALSLGLNVTAGFAGLLDLGYVAFYGIGAYGYAILASPHFDLHWPFWLVLPLMIAIGALFGLLLGSPSLRLQGDYLAIVTLGFGQIAGILFLNWDKVRVPLLNLAKPLNITGGPNGIIHVDDVRLLGFTFDTAGRYYFLILVFAALVLLAIYHMDRSRIGRAWRAIREDELAAQAMGVDVRRLKLLAFSVGASVAGATGVIFAAWQGAVFPPNFDVTILIILYSMVVLGGAGTIWGPVTGALILSILPELLRSPELSRVLFYGGLVVALVWAFRRRRLAGVGLLGAVGALGVAVKAILTWLRPEWLTQPEMAASVARSVSAPLVRAISWWMVYPVQARTVGSVAFVLTLGVLLLAYRLRGKARYALLVPGLYALAFVWETRLVEEPSVTRMLIFGALLVLVMNFRPQGIFGQRRVQRM